MRILFFGDGAWAASSLESLVASGHTLVAVVLRMQVSGGELNDAARSHGIRVLQPDKVNDPQFLSAVRALSPDIGVSIAYNQIFRLSAYAFLPLGLVNFHAGKLPSYRGRNVVNWAILNGETEIGLTSHFVDDGIDTGGIILQKLLPIGWTDGYGDVLNRVVSAFPSFVLESIAAIEAGDPTITWQTPEDGTYFPGRGPDDEWLEWDDSSFNLHNKIRAITHPGPGARTLFEGREIRIWRAYYDPAWKSYLATPGTVVARTVSGVHVKTRDSVLLIKEVEIPGHVPERPDWRIGTRLGLNVPALHYTLQARWKELEELLCNENRKRS